MKGFEYIMEWWDLWENDLHSVEDIALDVITLKYCLLFYNMFTKHHKLFWKLPFTEITFYASDKKVKSHSRSILVNFVHDPSLVDSICCMVQ